MPAPKTAQAIQVAALRAMPVGLPGLPGASHGEAGGDAAGGAGMVGWQEIK